LIIGGLEVINNKKKVEVNAKLEVKLQKKIKQKIKETIIIKYILINLKISYLIILNGNFFGYESN
jgi:hypothetical protein